MTIDGKERRPMGPFTQLDQSRVKLPKRLEIHSPVKAVETPPRLLCRATMSGNQSIPNATATALNFDLEIFDYGGLHDTAVNNNRMTVPVGKTTGLWLLHGGAIFAANATGRRQVSIGKNGATQRTVTVGVNSATDVTAVEITLYVLDPVPADYFELFVFQNSGGNLNCIGDFELIHIW